MATPSTNTAAVAHSPPLARYFPLAGGRYEVKAGLWPLGQDFGNGEHDKHVFQIDRQFAHYRTAKRAARGERLAKYLQHSPGQEERERHVACWMIERLLTEHPDRFVATRLPDGSTRLACQLTGETLCFDAHGGLAQTTGCSVEPEYAGALDALAMQIQEDIALVAADPDGRFRLIAVHLCLPNHWAAEEKIGADFTGLHGAVPDISHISRGADTLLARIAGGAGPYVRFAWGLGTDARLNHHPEPPPDVDAAHWPGRRFNPARPAAWLRVERQVLAGIGSADRTRANTGTVLFTIRTYHYPLGEVAVDPQMRAALMAALRSMSAEALAYKGLAQDREALLAWLATDASPL